MEITVNSYDDGRQFTTTIFGKYKLILSNVRRYCGEYEILLSNVRWWYFAEYELLLPNVRWYYGEMNYYFLTLDDTVVSMNYYCLTLDDDTLVSMNY